MVRTLLLILILLHLLGDYYLQPRGIAKKKETNYAFVCLHSLIYGAVLLAGTAVLWSLPILVMASILTALHFLLDSIKYSLHKANHKPSDAVIYCCDQCLHLVSIAAAVIVLKSAAVQPAFLPMFSGLQPLLPADPLTLLKWVCMIAVIGKPANVTIKKLLSQYKPNTDFQDPSRENAGAFIGTLERIIIALLLSVSQYAAIGLVLTAKSIARYDKIAKEQSFAEYYLLGTLLSTLLVIAAYLFLFTIL